MKQPKRIAVLRYRFIGDTLLTVPFLRELRRQFPEAHIDLYVGADGVEIMETCPYINNAIGFEPRQLGFWGAVNLLKEGKYDTAYVLKRSLSSALMAFLAGIPRRIGFNTDNRGLLLTKRIPYREREQHEALCLLDNIIPNAAEKNPDIHLETWIDEEVKEALRIDFQDKPGPRIVLHATSTNPAKCWPIGHFETLAEELVRQYDAHIYVLGTSTDGVGYAGLAEKLGDRMHNFCGKTSIIESLALLEQMDLVVANDSGMIHMAAAMKTPVVALFGPMDPVQWYPITDRATVMIHPSLTCRPCRMKITCHNQFPCLAEITPETVLSACKAYLTS